MILAIITQLVEALESGLAYVENEANQLTTREYKAAITAAREYLATEPSGERADSAQWLREFADMEFSYYSREATQLRKAADMLEADAQQDKPYDQQSMDLCDTCGWKGIFPGEPCLVCAQQVKRVPLSDDQIEELAEGIAWDDYAHDLARRVEKHHGITPADKPTDDESEDLYALALKADNWGQP